MSDLICFICKRVIFSPEQSIRVRRGRAYRYDLPEEAIPKEGVRVCRTCHQISNARLISCPLPYCPKGNEKVRKLVAIPFQLAGISPSAFISEFKIPAGISKCCKSCYDLMRIRLKPSIFNTSQEGDLVIWSAKEVLIFDRTLREVGSNKWATFRRALPGRTKEQCKEFYNVYYATPQEHRTEEINNERELERAANEESESSTTSQEKQQFVEVSNSDTARPGSAEYLAGPESPIIDILEVTADESLPGEAMYLPGTSTSSATGPPGPRQSAEDLMANVIEKQLNKDPGGVGMNCTSLPTISSILGTDPSGLKRGNGRSLPELFMIPQNGPQKTAKRSYPELILPDEEGTIIDLSMKKRGNSGADGTSRNFAYDPYARAPIPNSTNWNLYSTPMAGFPEPPNQTMAARGPNINSGPPAGVPKVTPKALPSTQSSAYGSITHGIHPAYQHSDRGVLRYTPRKDGGSITQGTPVQYEMPVTDNSQNIGYKWKSHPASRRDTVVSPFPHELQPAPFHMEQHLTSQQILMNDYITSQQMQGNRRVSTSAGKRGGKRAAAPMFTAPPIETGYQYAQPSSAMPPPPPLHQYVVPTSQMHGNRRVPTSAGNIGDTRAATPMPTAPPMNTGCQYSQPGYAPSPPPLRQGVIRRHESQGQMFYGQQTGNILDSHPHLEEFRSLAEAPSQGFPVPSRDKTMKCCEIAMEHQNYKQQDRINKMHLHHQIRVDFEERPRKEQHRFESLYAQQRNRPLLDYEASQLQCQQMAEFFDTRLHSSIERGREWDIGGAGIIQMNHRDRHFDPQLPIGDISPKQGTSVKSKEAGILMDTIITQQTGESSQQSHPRAGGHLFQGFPTLHEETTGKCSRPKRPVSQLQRNSVETVNLPAEIDNVVSKEWPNYYSNQYQQERTHGKRRKIFNVEQSPLERQAICKVHPLTTGNMQSDKPTSLLELWSAFAPGDCDTNGKYYEKLRRDEFSLDYVESHIEVMPSGDSAGKKSEGKSNEAGSPSVSEAENNKKPQMEGDSSNSREYARPYSTLRGVYGKRSSTVSKPPNDGPAPMCPSKYEDLGEGGD